MLADKKEKDEKKKWDKDRQNYNANDGIRNENVTIRNCIKCLLTKKHQNPLKLNTDIFITHRNINNTVFRGAKIVPHRLGVGIPFS